VRTHLSHIIWAMIFIPGLIAVVGAWRSRRGEAAVGHPAP